MDLIYVMSIHAINYLYWKEQWNIILQKQCCKSTFDGDFISTLSWTPGQSKCVLLSLIKNGLWPSIVKTTKAPLFKPLHLQQEHLIDLSEFLKNHHNFKSFSLSFGHTHTQTHSHPHITMTETTEPVKCLPSNRDIIIFFQHKITLDQQHFVVAKGQTLCGIFGLRKVGLSQWRFRQVRVSEGLFNLTCLRVHSHGHCSKGQTLLLCCLTVTWAGVL